MVLPTITKRQKITFLLSFFLLPLFFTRTILAQENKFVVNINPVRGLDFWSAPNQTPNDFVIFQKKLAGNYKYNLTWLLRPDYFLKNSNNIFLNNRFDNDDIGIFLEVTPSWTNRSNIEYNSRLTWYHPHNIFLSGYNPKDRLILLDDAFNDFKKIFGYYPKSVGAWHIDAYSAQYLVDKYQVSNFLICADQSSTDHYSIWGTWWRVPFYPSKNNLLVPAQNHQNKLNALVLFWAARDPINGYGPDKSSLYSVQANDYLQLELDTNYFKKLSDIYLEQDHNPFGQLTIGLENDNSLVNLRDEFSKQIESLKQYQFLTAKDFANWYIQEFPDLSPDMELSGIDPLGSNTQFKWLLNKDQRTALIKTGSSWETIDIHQYHKNQYDPYFFYKNQDNDLYWRLPGSVDKVFLPSNSHKTYTLSPYLLSIIVLVISILFTFLFIKNKQTHLLIIFFCSLIISLTMFFSGLKYDFGLGFWGPNGHDGIWHLSLINQLKRGVPPQNPVFSGSFLTKYHWGYDLFVAIISRLTSISPSLLYFQILPFLFAFLIGILSYRLAFFITKNKITSTLFVLLNYFAGSAGWIYTLIFHNRLGGESLFWSMQSISTLLNPPFALSLVIILITLLIFLKGIDKNRYQISVLSGVLFGLLTGIKIYSAVLIAFALGILCLYTLIFQKNKFKYVFITCLSFSVIAVLILILLGIFNSASLLEFKPFWFIQSMIESVDKFYWPKLASYRFNQSNKLILIIVNLSLVALFLIGNFWTRILGVLSIGHQSLQKHHWFRIVSLSIIFLSIVLPTFFVQTGTAWNTIQFLYYGLFFANFYLALFLSSIFRKHQFLVYLIVFLSIITTFPTLKDYLGFPPPASLPNYELEALTFLKKQPYGYVLTFPYDNHKKDKLDTPIPLYAYETTAYVSAFSDKPVFLEDEMNLDITGFNWQERRQDVENFFTNDDKYKARGLLVNNSIDYIYLIHNQKLNFSEEDLQVKKIFDNGQSRIYKVQR